MTNHLASSTSPYLLQHKDNPVDWWEWSPQALAEAQRRDVPILLSVGYSACHWCHVMAHECFEDAEVAAAMNAGFVNIKVDREERPDIDAVYMQATVALTGQGGWPMTCLLTPDQVPFFAGTFIPRGQFLSLLGSVSQAWRQRRDEVVEAGQNIMSALATQVVSGAPAELGTQLLEQAVAALAAEADQANGGFGGAPKFPPSMVLEFLLRHHERTGDPRALALVTRTCDAMARGGIYDQLGGGFARYSVDAAWVVPHFEKMLYDNAQLLRVYLHLWRRTESPLARRIAVETAEFLLRDMATAEGGFASALDADTDAVEGATYVWTREQLHAATGDNRAADLFAVAEEGNFEHGFSTLQLPRDADDQQWWSQMRLELLKIRADRQQPQRDDKVVTSWNGLAISALAEAGVLLDSRYLDAANAAAELMQSTHLVQGRLRRSSRAGVVGGADAVAEDYGNLAAGLLMLHQATGQPRWLTLAGELLDTAITHFRAPDGGFFDTSDYADALVSRPREEADNASPSGHSCLADALLTYSVLTGSSRYRQVAEETLRSISWLGQRYPRSFGHGLSVAEAMTSGPVQIAVVGQATQLIETELVQVAWRLRPAGAVVVSGAPGAAGVPLLADRPLAGGQPTAYVCQGFVCELPVTDVASLQTQLSSL